MIAQAAKTDPAKRRIARAVSRAMRRFRFMFMSAVPSKADTRSLAHARGGSGRRAMRNAWAVPWRCDEDVAPPAVVAPGCRLD